MKAITEVDKPLIPLSRPDHFFYQVIVTCSQDREFSLKLQIPWWVSGVAAISVNGTPQEGCLRDRASTSCAAFGAAGIRPAVEQSKALVTQPLPGAPDMVVFVDSPVVLARLTEEERLLVGDAGKPRRY